MKVDGIVEWLFNVAKKDHQIFVDQTKLIVQKSISFDSTLFQSSWPTMSSFPCCYPLDPSNLTWPPPSALSTHGKVIFGELRWKLFWALRLYRTNSENEYICERIRIMKSLHSNSLNEPFINRPRHWHYSEDSSHVVNGDQGQWQQAWR